MKIGVIVLCRYNSSRLPGKILLKINGMTVLQHIISRLQHVFPANSIVVATSDESSDDVISDYCSAHKINCFRGSLNNVAERFLACAVDYRFDFAFRINGDNIFIDLSLIKFAIEKVEFDNVSFISNVDKRTFPKGMSIEGVNVSLYKKLMPEFSPYEQEHVMPYMYINVDKYKHLFIYNTDYPELAGIQLAVDTKEDLKQVEDIMSKLGPLERDYKLEDIAKVIKKQNLR